MSEETIETLENVKRHIDYLDATNQSSIRDNEMRVMYYEIERLNNIITELEKYIRDILRIENVEDEYIDREIERVKNCTINSQNDAIKNNDEAIKGK